MHIYVFMIIVLVIYIVYESTLLIEIATYDHFYIKDVEKLHLLHNLVNTKADEVLFNDTMDTFFYDVLTDDEKASVIISVESEMTDDDILNLLRVDI